MTRRHLYRTALRIIGSEGYENTTLRHIAKDAQVSPGLLYKYFPSKRSVVLALYDDLSHQYATEAEVLPQGKWTARFLFALKTSLRVLGPERSTLSALIPILVNTGNEGLFSPATEFSRKRVQAVFAKAVYASANPPKNNDAIALSRVLYFLHLAVILWWLLDKSPQQRATRSLLVILEIALPLASIALKSKKVRSILNEGDVLIGDAFLGSAQESA